MSDLLEYIVIVLTILALIQGIEHRCYIGSILRSLLLVRVRSGVYL